MSGSSHGLGPPPPPSRSQGNRPAHRNVSSSSDHRMDDNFNDIDEDAQAYLDDLDPDDAAMEIVGQLMSGIRVFQTHSYRGNNSISDMLVPTLVSFLQAFTASTGLSPIPHTAPAPSTAAAPTVPASSPPAPPQGPPAGLAPATSLPPVPRTTRAPTAKKVREAARNTAAQAGATAAKPALSYAAAARAGTGAVVQQLAAAFPKTPAVDLVHMAAKIAPKRGHPAKARHSPRHSSRIVTITFAEGHAPLAKDVPSDADLLRQIKRELADDLRDLNKSTEPPILLLAVHWNHRGRFRLLFSEPVPSSLEDPIHAAFLDFVRDLQPSTDRPVRLERFQFTSKAVFRRVPARTFDLTLNTAETLTVDLRSDKAWADVHLTRPPNFYVPTNSAYGFFFVEFRDNASSKLLKKLCSSPVILGGDSCFAVKTHDAKPTVPLCDICARWGHRSHLCRSPIRRCWYCGGAHDERKHHGECSRCKDDMVVTGTCGHPPHCLNCGGQHRADAKVCSFYTHRRDRMWIRSHTPRNLLSNRTGAPTQVNPPSSH